MSSNAGLKQASKDTQFKKGDPRINRKGRPKAFDAFRALGQKIANETVEVATKKLGAETPKPELAKLKVAEYLLRKWAFSNDPVLQKAFAEVTYGKPPLTVDTENIDDVTSVEVRIIRAQ